MRKTKATKASAVVVETQPAEPKTTEIVIDPEWSKPATPDKLPSAPWLHPYVVDFLARIVRPTWRVLEHGAGGSTLWLAGRVAHVLSIEEKPAWYEKLVQIIPENVNLLLWDQPRMNELPKELFDLLIIDGEPIANRIPFIRRATKLVRPGGWVVLDNCNRPEYPTERAELQKACQHYVTFMTHPGAFTNTEFYHLREA